MLRLLQIRARRRHNSHHNGTPAPSSHAECNASFVHTSRYDSDLPHREKPCHKSRTSDGTSGTEWTVAGFIGVPSGFDCMSSFLFLIYIDLDLDSNANHIRIRTGRDSPDANYCVTCRPISLRGRCWIILRSW